MHMQGDIREQSGELMDHRRQGVACLGMGSGDTQLTARLITEFLGDTTNGFGLLENFAGNAQNRLPGWSDMGQVLATASKDLNPKFVFQHADLLADTRLRGVERSSGGRHIQIMARDFPDVA